MFGVHQGQDRVEQKSLGNFIVHEKGLRHRPWICQAGRLNDDAVKAQQALAAFGCQQLQGGPQVFTDRAADAAIAHLDDLLIGFRNQNVGINVLFAELIFDDRNFLPVGFSQDALEQCGFARTQETGQDGGGNKGHEGAPLKGSNNKSWGV